MKNTRMFSNESEIRALSDSDIARLVWLGEGLLSDYNMLLAEATKRELSLSELWKLHE